jgi:hypothetical protein
VVRDDQPDAREGQAGVAERFVVPQFGTDARSGWGTWKFGNLSTPDSVQKLQTGLHTKAKAEYGYRF